MYDVKTTAQFQKDVKFYKRKKRYIRIMDDIGPIVKDLKAGNFVGDELSDMGLSDNEHSYKVRAANTDMNVGTSNGYRIIYYVIKDDKTVFLLTIFSKKDKENLTKKEISDLVKEYCT